MQTEIKVGETTLESSFRVTVSDYGVEIPECHTTSPIISPMLMPLYLIINLIERGLHVHFEDEDKAEKILIFVTEYNKAAALANQQAKKEINKVANTTERYLLKKLHAKIAREDKKREEEIPNPFKRIIWRDTSKINPGLSAEDIQNRFKLKKGGNKKRIAKLREQRRMYDFFTPPMDEYTMLTEDDFAMYDFD